MGPAAICAGCGSFAVQLLLIHRIGWAASGGAGLWWFGAAAESEGAIMVTGIGDQLLQIFVNNFSVFFSVLINVIFDTVVSPLLQSLTDAFRF